MNNVQTRNVEKMTDAQISKSEIDTHTTPMHAYINDDRICMDRTLVSIQPWEKSVDGLRIELPIR